MAKGHSPYVEEGDAGGGGPRGGGTDCAAGCAAGRVRRPDPVLYFQREEGISFPKRFGERYGSVPALPPSDLPDDTGSGRTAQPVKVTSSPQTGPCRSDRKERKEFSGSSYYLFKVKELIKCLK